MKYTVRAITAGPRRHFFGYYEMRPWDRSGRYHLVLEVDFMDRRPTPQDEVTLGVVDLGDGDRFRPLARVKAWSWQQGCMQHWLAGTPDTVLFNDRRDGQFVCVAHEMGPGRQRIIGPAIAALTADGRLGATLNFARIAVTRPGYGYEGLADPFAAENESARDGLGILDLAAGRHAMALTFADVAERLGKAFEHAGKKMYFNHVLFNPSGTRLAVIVRWVLGEESWATQMWTVGPRGEQPTLALAGPMVSHYAWKDDDTFVAWARVDGADAMYEVDALNRAGPRAVFTDTIRCDGHICYSPDRRWVVCDTYPDGQGKRHLFLVNCTSGQRVELGAYFSMPVPFGDIRCDLHPSFSDDGRQLAFDSTHDGSRQRYVLTMD